MAHQPYDVKGKDRNVSCHCGSGVKYKKCCGKRTANPLHKNRSFNLLDEKKLDIVTNDLNDGEYDVSDLIAAFSDIPMSEFENECPRIVEALKEFHPIETAISFSSLLTMPEIQSNGTRLEAMVLFSLMYCEGIKTPSFTDLQEWFADMNHSTYGSNEGPAETVFLSNVSTSAGNFRIFGALHDADAFYLQMILNVVDVMPRRSEFEGMRRKIDAMLRLSEMVANRLGLDRHTLGQLFPLQELPSSLSSQMTQGKEFLRFTVKDLSALSIRREDLEPFLFSIDSRDALKNADSLHSSLEDTPLISFDDIYYLLLPTSVGVAIRQYVVKTIASFKLIRSFEHALVLEYQGLFFDTYILGKIKNLTVKFFPTGDGFLGTYTVEVDIGRFIQFIYFIDNIWSSSSDSHKNSSLIAKKGNVDFEAMIRETRTEVSATSNFKSGISLIVGCGWGRRFSYRKVANSFDNWYIDYISGPDLITLSWKEGLDPVILFTLFNTVDKLRQNNINILNVNGLLNLYAYIDNNNGHLIPREGIPEGFGKPQNPSIITIEPFELAIFRSEVSAIRDEHSVLSDEGNWIRVYRENGSRFKEDLQKPLYIPVKETLEDRLRAIYEKDEIFWWLEAISSADDPRNNDVKQQFQMLKIWLPRVVEVIKLHTTSFPSRIIYWKVYLHAIDTTPPESPLREDQLRKLIHLSVDFDKATINLESEPRFNGGYHNTRNLAEKIIVEEFIRGIFLLSGVEFDQEKISSLAQLVVKSPDARHIHGFFANSFRNYLPEFFSEFPVFTNTLDDEILHLGLCWEFSERGETTIIEGKDECKNYLNALVRRLENSLCAEIGSYDRRKLVEAILTNIERTAFNKALWRNTSKAMIALYDDVDLTFQTILDHDHKLNANLLASRALVEVALCECLIDKGKMPGALDVARLMSKVIYIAHLGEWSNLIHYDCMEPYLEITPIGDIRANVSFIEDVVGPYSTAGNKRQVLEAMEEYDRHFSQADYHHSVNDSFNASFLDAWQDEFGFTIDECRVFLDLVENVGLERNQAILELSESDLLNMAMNNISKTAVEKIVENFSSIPRKGWHTVPEGYNDAERHIWRFRRRLSLLRRPLIQLTEGKNPNFMLAPGMLREGFIYTLSHYYDGGFNQDHARAAKMKGWFGTAAVKNGAEFNQQVENRMHDLGWQVKSGIKLTEIFGKPLDLDYGDVDVLAWDPHSKRILLMECKDLKFGKTPRELAEQLFKYRGVSNSGKRDALKKHLDRIEVLQRNADVLTKYLGMPLDSVIEGHLTFKNMVPMQFAWEHMRQFVTLSVFDDLFSFRLERGEKTED